MSFKDTPIICSPYAPPSHHYALGDDGQPTGEKRNGRRDSTYLVPVPLPRRRVRAQAELGLEVEGAKSRVSENHLINQIRRQVDSWRALSPAQWGVTPETQRLLLHWRSPERERKLFFCQREAVETLIYLTEVDSKRFRKELEDANAEANPELFRMACKMATGSGKTTVMGMLIAWHAINRARRQSSRTYSDAFLIVTPGITIRDRLRVLLPQDTDNIYQAHDLVPPDLMEAVHKARIVITNFHAFQPHYSEEASALNKRILAGRERDPSTLFRETDGEMVERIAPELMKRRNIIVMNDEAHHCYQERIGVDEEEKLDAEEKDEAERSRKAARVWINGIKAFNRVLGRGSRDPGVAAVYDLSATPFFLRGSGYDEGTLFKWVVSDFSLLDAIESGIVKVPRLPVLDDSISGDMPKYRQLYANLKETKALPRKGLRKQGAMDPELINPLLEGALRALYGHYEGELSRWKQAKLDREPVFIVVANNTATSKLIFDWIAGYERTIGEGEKAETRIVQGKLPLFSNVLEEGGWSRRPRTILIDSEQLESGELSDDFRKAAAREIEEFKKEIRRREGEGAAEKLTAADLLREAMNTVGKPGKLGGDLRCVVSVSMLTEGWDANTVTHVLGVRAFRAALLSEQVVGRALRRVSYEPDPETGLFRAEYADVLGVPYIFATEGKDIAPPPPAKTTRVKAMPDRKAREIAFPNVEGYRVIYPRERLKAEFTTDSRLTLTPDDVPTKTLNEPLIGESTFLGFDAERKYRDRSVAYQVAGHTLRTFFRDEDGAVQVWRYPDLLRITEKWMSEYLICSGGVPKQILRWPSLAQRAAERIARACTPSKAGEEAIRPILNAYNQTGRTGYISFDTARTTLFATRADKCHLNYVVYDKDWEAGFAARVEEMDEVVSYVKNHNLHFEVPYLHNGEPHRYRPDYIVKLDDGHGPDDCLNLVVEIKGLRDDVDATKAETIRKIWIPAVNNTRRFGRWDFIEFQSTPYDVAGAIRAHIGQRQAA
jgi:type III restriction enzyme